MTIKAEKLFNAVKSLVEKRKKHIQELDIRYENFLSEVESNNSHINIEALKNISSNVLKSSDIFIELVEKVEESHRRNKNFNPCTIKYFMAASRKVLSNNSYRIFISLFRLMTIKNSTFLKDITKQTEQTT